ncbi:MFS transporter [archaeon]|nr:MFS transporter [archaeon]
MEPAGKKIGGDRDGIPFLRAFRSRNYRLFFVGQSFSLIGTWMQQVALSWLIYRLTGSAMLLGIIGFVSQIPSLFISPVAGVLADRWDRRNLLLATQCLAMVQAVILSALVIAGVIRIWEIILLSVLMGIVNSFDVPIRQAFVVEMVEAKEDLANAIALNSSMFHGTRLIGPALAGILIGIVGEGVCFLVNAFSYLAVICSLMAMATIPAAPHASDRRIIPELREGFTYAYRSTPIRYILMLLSFVSLLGIPYVVLLPVFAREILHGGAHTYGFLMTASGIGSLAAALYIAARKNVFGLGRIIAFSPAVMGLSIIAFSFSRSLLLSLVTLMFAGFGMMIQIASSNTILQTIVDDDKRGRIMSLYTMSFMGMAPFGCLFVGALAGHIGATRTVFMAGVCCIMGSAFFICGLPRFRREVRHVYERLSIEGKVQTARTAPGKDELAEDNG